MEKNHCAGWPADSEHSLLPHGLLEAEPDYNSERKEAGCDVKVKLDGSGQTGLLEMEVKKGMVSSEALLPKGVSIPISLLLWTLLTSSPFPPGFSVLPQELMALTEVTTDLQKEVIWEVKLNGLSQMQQN